LQLAGNDLGGAQLLQIHGRSSHHQSAFKTPASPTHVYHVELINVIELKILSYSSLDGRSLFLILDLFNVHPLNEYTSSGIFDNSFKPAVTLKFTKNFRPFPKAISEEDRFALRPAAMCCFRYTISVMKPSARA
jgi:hypothetical protein